MGGGVKIRVPYCVNKRGQTCPQIPAKRWKFQNGLIFQVRIPRDKTAEESPIILSCSKIVEFKNYPTEFTGYSDENYLNLCWKMASDGSMN